MRSHYDVLEVERSASPTEIKSAYRRLALRFHPDRNQGDASAEAKFKDLSIAYAVLSDEGRRRQYDQFGAVGEGAGMPFDPNLDVSGAKEFFDAILGDLLGFGRKKEMGKDLRYTLELKFEEAALGCTKSIEFESPVDCAACFGTGAAGGASGLIPCPPCEGRGSIGGKMFLPGKECSACGGAGEVPRTRCETCGGDGQRAESRKFDVKIQPQSFEGAVTRIPGEGAPGRRGGAAGDLHINMRVTKHPIYRFEKGVLLCDLPITMTQAALGHHIEVPLIDGRAIMEIPTGTQNGTLFRLRGRGLGGKDAHVRVSVEIPKGLTDEALGRLARLSQLIPDSAYPKTAGYDAILKDIANADDDDSK